MSTDRELLMAAAKAAGIEVPKESPWAGVNDSDGIWRDISSGGDGTRHSRWNPLKNDGDALRLAVKLQLNELWFDRSTGRPEVVCGKPGTGTIAVEPLGDDPCAATRRAIVRAAAAMHPNGGTTR